jgi:mannose-1-phosphate guanylyltransferase
VDRVVPIIPPERVWVVTAADQADDLRSQAPRIPEGNFLIEPAPRGTASVIGLAAIILLSQDPDACMACLTADHYIADVDGFRDVLRAAFALAGEGDLVTLGIKPSYPATGFGYIESGAARGDVRGHPSFHVTAFKEKPDRTLAEQYLATGRYSWNSGMFIWRADRILPEIERQMPALFGGLMEIRVALGTSSAEAVLGRVWKGLEKQTIDYGVMEGARNVSVIPADGLGWWDLGGWDRLFEIMKPDAAGNLVLGGNIRTLQTKGTLVYQDRGEETARLVVTLGVEDLVIVDTEDVILVCERNEVESIRRLVEQLEREGKEEYL